MAPWSALSAVSGRPDVVPFRRGNPIVEHDRRAARIRAGRSVARAAALALPHRRLEQKASRALHARVAGETRCCRNAAVDAGAPMAVRGDRRRSRALPFPLEECAGNPWAEVVPRKRIGDARCRVGRTTRPIAPPRQTPAARLRSRNARPRRRSGLRSARPGRSRPQDGGRPGRAPPRESDARGSSQERASPRPWSA